MKTFTKMALFFLLISVCIHTYLTLHHYPLKFGYSSGPSICSINQTFDCDAVSVSGYSEFLGIPVSVWGGVTCLVIFFALLVSWLEWTENPERLKRFAFAGSFGLALGSFVMGGISVFYMTNYCLFCIALYVLSFCIVGFIYPTLKEPFLKNFPDDIKAYFVENRGILGMIIAIPVLSFLIHRMSLNRFGAGQLDRIVNSGVSEWIRGPMQSLSVDPLLVKGPEEEKARLTISEFADFRCPHCKHASHTLHAFVNAHPDVRFEFYVFPLDGACNNAIKSFNGLSCFLAKAVYCAEKQSQGWTFHDIIFQYQDQLSENREVPRLGEDLTKLTSHLSLNTDEFNTCVDSPDTQEAIQYQSQQGVQLGIEGTPAIFANGKLLDGGQLIPVLEAVYKRADQSPKK